MEIIFYALKNKMDEVLLWTEVKLGTIQLDFAWRGKETTSRLCTVNARQFSTGQFSID